MKKVFVMTLFALMVSLFVFMNAPESVSAEMVQSEEDSYIYYEDIDFVQIELGRNHSIAITSEGRVFSCGGNDYGQLGVGIITSRRFTLQEITNQFGLIENEVITSLSLGNYHSSVITSEGRVFTWGRNNEGQLGDGTITSYYDGVSTPTEITSHFDLNEGEIITSVSLGSEHSAVITSEGRVFTWGFNGYGQLGDDTTIDKNTPTEITSLFSLTTGEIITSISLGDSHTSAITSEGRVFTWGRNNHGQLGDGTTTNKSVPTEITSQFGLADGELVMNISLGYYHSAAITSTGRVFTWGSNDYGQLGDDTIKDRYIPTEITTQFSLTSREELTDLFLGSSHSSVITSEGRVFTWGRNNEGQLGDGTITLNDSNPTPTEITNQFVLAESETVTNLSLGLWHSSAITSSGRIFTWGWNKYGQLGDGTIIDRRLVPIEIGNENNLLKVLENKLPVGEKIINLSVGYYYSSAITSTGRVFTWGSNDYGQLGNGTTTGYEPNPIPIEITSLFGLLPGEKVTGLSLGSSHSSAISSEGKVFTWGNNGVGQLGDGTTTDKNTPTEITSQFGLAEGETVTSLSLGRFHSSAITSSGRIFTWGWNNYGQLGDGTTTNKSVPTEITSQFDLIEDERVTSVSLGADYSAAITSEDRVFAWGKNDYGQLGDGTTTNKHTPTEITSQFGLLPGETVKTISLGRENSSAITTGNRVFTWGSNHFGQLGDGTTTDKSVPIEITGRFGLNTEETVTKLSLGGYYHSSAITSEGRVFTWGYNGSGKLGDGTTTNRHTPTEITNQFDLILGETVTSLSLGRSHTSAITSEGRVFTWGYNGVGQLGNVETGLLNYIYVPIEFNKIYSFHNRILKTYSEHKQNNSLSELQISLFPQYEIIDDIQSININGNEYLDITNENGRIDVYVPVTSNIIDVVDYTINTITFANGIVMDLTGDLTMQTSFVKDMWAPTISFDYEQDLYIVKDIGDSSYLAALATDDTGESVDVTIDGNVDWTVTGIYDLTYTAADTVGNTATRTRTVTVLPEITTESESYDDMTFYYLGDVEYSDSLDLSQQIIRYDNKSYKPTKDYSDYEYQEDANNLIYKFEINNRLVIVDKLVQDTISPEVQLNPSLDTIQTGSEYQDYGVTITDATDTTINVSGYVDTTTPGTYVLTYTVTDEGGNETTVERYVTVYDSIPTVEFILGDANTTINVGDAYVDGTCTVVVNETDHACTIKENTVDSSTAGIYHITYAYTHNEKEYTYKRYVFVTDGEASLQLDLPDRKEEGVEI